MKTNKTILISAYRNVSIRYLLYGGILDEIINSNLNVVVLVNKENIEYYRDKFKHKLSLNIYNKGFNNMLIIFNTPKAY